jgi:orotate phosphoribosyltransferase
VNQLDRKNKFLAAADRSIIEALNSAQAAHLSVLQAQVGLTRQEIEYAQNQIQKALHQIYQAQSFIDPESTRLSQELQAEQDRLLHEYQLFL